MRDSITLINAVAIFSGGGGGCLLRWIFSILATKITGKFWIGTLFVNIVGSILLVSLYKWLQTLPEEYNLMLRTGFLGGLTTFSTFSWEVAHFVRQGNIQEGVFILLLNIFFGVVISIGIYR